MCMCVYRKVKDELPVCLKTKILTCIPKKEIETLHLRLNIYDLTSSS